MFVASLDCSFLAGNLVFDDVLSLLKSLKVLVVLLAVVA